jgi:hypothetical protein
MKWGTPAFKITNLEKRLRHILHKPTADCERVDWDEVFRLKKRVGHGRNLR